MYLWGDNRPYNSYAAYFRRLFGSRVQKVAVNAGFTCPNRDGSLSTGGCTFCNNSAFTPSYCQPVTPAINLFRYGFLGTGEVDWLFYGIGWVTTAAVAVIGALMFSKSEKTFMDTV